MRINKIFLNGRFVPEEEARISVLDRGFTYGDGLFETMRVIKGTLFHWSAHLARLQRGLDFLQIRLPIPAKELEQAARALAEENATPDAVLRLVVSRGPGIRGYSPRGANTPTLVMTLHDLPQPPIKPLRLRTSSFRLKAGDPFLKHKTCNKLLHIMARVEAEQHGFDDALLLNDRDELVTATSANLFLVSGNAIRTAPVAAGALPGITRAIIEDICAAERIDYRVESVTAAELKQSEGAFLGSTILGITPIGMIDTQSFKTPRLLGHLATRLDA